MSDQIYNVLFLCTANSARSILAEAILSRVGAGRFRAFSAGSYPKGKVHPYALQLLESLNYDTAFARSKSWDEFAEPGAPEMDFVFTVCDDAANETCPVWPGQPMTAHWSVPDPSSARRHGSRDPSGLCRGVPHAQQPHHDLHQPADGDPRPSGAAAASRRDRPQAAKRGRGLMIDLSRRLAAEALGTGVAGRDRCRLRHHGGSADRRCGPGAARQHAADRRHPGGADHHSRADLGRAFQSGRDAGLCAAP